MRAQRLEHWPEKPGVGVRVYPQAFNMASGSVSVCDAEGVGSIPLFAGWSRLRVGHQPFTLIMRVESRRQGYAHSQR